MNYLQLFLSIAPLVLTIFGLYFAWIRWRVTELRRDEVLSWANECIECLQTVHFISTFDDPILSGAKRNEIRQDAIVRTSFLIERGRLFFKNEVTDDFGSEKFPAYMGYRPRILDPLVAAHQVARIWPAADKDEIRKRSVVAEDSLRQFVSLAQEEVGRQRAASKEALRGGDGIRLSALMDAVGERSPTY